MKLLLAALVAGSSLVGFAPTAHAADTPPPRVTGLSNFFDYCQTGSTLAIPEVYGIGTGMVNLAISQFPAEANPVTSQVLLAEAAGPETFQAMAPGAAKFIAAGRAGAAPLAQFNPQANAFLQAMADGTHKAADQLHPLVQPGDVTMRQFADYIGGLQQK
jgi:tape measure domain-containing protein